jgi:glucan phosphoethanolaminetransferase (alkaline phosphatase superfamily)
MNFNYTVITILTIAFFVTPIAVVLYKRRIEFEFNLAEITRLINVSLIYQFILGTILYLLFIVIGEQLVHVVFSREIYTSLSAATVWFSIIAVIYYIPSLILLNLIDWILKRKKKKPTHNNT